MGVNPKIGVQYPPKSSILIGFSIINHPFWSTPIFGNTQMDDFITLPEIKKMDGWRLED